MQLLPNGLLVAPLHTYIHALADVFKRPDLPMALPKSTLAPTNIVGNDAVKALLFHNTVAIQETHGFAPNVAQLFETFIVKPFFVTDP